MNSLYIGIDIGTSGCRCIAINDEKAIVGSVSAPLPEPATIDGHITQKPETWWLICQQALTNLLSQIPKAHVKSISVDGTSGSVLLCSSKGEPLSPAYMYNDNNNALFSSRIADIAPQNSGAHGASSGLAKCLSLLQKYNPPKEARCLTQADWIAGQLTHDFTHSDQNNSLKLGYDIVNQEWPAWLNDLNCLHYLPQNIHIPGTPIACIAPDIAKDLDLPQTTQIIAGTTDSIAAFIATECTEPGEAVTSLGSTLAIKLITDTPIFSPQHGVYSHRLGDHWLVGGASNTGGAVIKKYFTPGEIKAFTQKINPSRPTNLDYYPLPSTGERFPLFDNQLEPRLTPRPTDKLTFFQGILEGISRIEKLGYDKLTELGSTPPTRITTMGGGSSNKGWREIRQNMLGIPVRTSKITEAAYGAALLARQGFKL